MHLLLHTPLLNKTPRLSSARTFVRLYRLLLIHCIYVSVSKQTCPAFSAWLNTGAIRPIKVTGKAIMLCSYGINIKVMCSTTWQSNVGSMCDCKPCGSLDLSVLVEILSRVDSDHCTGLRRNGSVNPRSTLCPIEIRSCLPKKLLEALIWQLKFRKLDNFFLLDLASIKT